MREPNELSSAIRALADAINRFGDKIEALDNPSIVTPHGQDNPNPREMIDCYRCEGRKTTILVNHTPNGPRETRIECLRCHGEGKIEAF